MLQNEIEQGIEAVDKLTLSRTNDARPPAGWSGSIADLLELGVAPWVEALTRFINRLNLTVGEGQVNAWRDCYATLHREFSRLIRECPEAASWGVVAEYELPRENGRRPDIVILVPKALLVLEFKGTQSATTADVDQVSAYARDLSEYHSASRDRRIAPIVVLTRSHSPAALHGNVYVVGSSQLSVLLRELSPREAPEPRDLAEWLAGDYAPLPTLIAAARRIFEHEPLPAIRRAHSAGIPAALRSLTCIAQVAEQQKERHLALVTGVPGAGKTLVGLQFVYETRFGESQAERPAVFLSGNGPLVDVLQYALKTRIFVQDVHGFLLRYGAGNNRLPEEHIWVYDEAQRAWDADRVLGKRGHGVSEPEDFVRLGRAQKDWAMLVGLIGHGQEIHIGEEAGLAQWNEAVRDNGDDFTIHCPSAVAPLFEGRKVVIDDALDLTTTLRSHLAADLHQWVGKLLGADLEAARALAHDVIQHGFRLYVTRSLDDAREYVRARYAGQSDNRFGLLASSKATSLAAYGIDSSFQGTRRFRSGPWYNDAPDTTRSCCQLLEVATEFAAQGLELDLPIVAWGNDLWWADGWTSRASTRTKARDPHQLRVNSYRVLLTRGRDGMVIFVPPIVAATPTYEALLLAGCTELPNNGSGARLA